MAKIDDSVKKKVPELRFKGFTDDWEERKLSEGTSKIGDGLHGTPNYSDNGDVFFINGNNLVNGKIVITKETKLVTESNQSKDDKLLNMDTILMSINGTIGNLAWYNNERVMLGKSAAYLTVSNFDKKFIFSYLQTSTIKNYFLNNLTGTTIKNLGLKTIRDTTLFVPTLEEQQKIGSFFKQLDDTIALHQRKLDLLKEQKKGYLQKMFPKNGAKVPELRFAGFADDWEERKLGDTETHFTDGNYGESYPSAKDMSDKANGIPFLRGSDFSNGYLDSSNANYIKPEKHAELTSGHIKQDDIVLAVRGSLGTLGYATQENEGWNINSQLAILRTKKSEISGMFLIQYLLGSKGQKEIFSRNTGTALKQLPIKQLKDIPVPVPTLLEQQKIGNFFKELDSTIALHQRKLDLLKEQKKGFLQKMFV
ncbi:restriction endonuclease subunit S [Lactococcus formosensis]|nr:restriction endonuclease subunit S [Lactococcus formosensis]MDG6161062.1 restriction endonuclease subunit S [Lactococcus formosensis]